MEGHKTTHKDRGRGGTGIGQTKTSNKDRGQRGTVSKHRHNPKTKTEGRGRHHSWTQKPSNEDKGSREGSVSTTKYQIQKFERKKQTFVNINDNRRLIRQDENDHYWKGVDDISRKKDQIYL